MKGTFSREVGLRGGREQLASARYIDSHPSTERSLPFKQEVVKTRVVSALYIHELPSMQTLHMSQNPNGDSGLAYVENLHRYNSLLLFHL